jgi:AcrR family transcriptional regulator
MKAMNETTATRTSSRDRILSAAIHLFACNGYENTSTLSIARAAHTSETQLVKNFINKEGLLEAAFTAAMIKLAAVLPEVEHLTSPREKLRELFHRAIAVLDENPELKMILLLEMRRVRRKITGNVMVPPAVPDFVSQVDGILEEASRMGQLKGELRPQLIRSALFGAVAELLRDPLVGADSVTPMVTSDEVLQVVDRMLTCFFV